MTALAPASHHPRVQLTAWTVAKQADGDVTVSIFKLSDPAALQAKLRAEGVPASIVTAGTFGQSPARPRDHSGKADARVRPCSR